MASGAAAEVNKMKALEDRIKAPSVWGRMAIGLRFEDLQDRRYDEAAKFLKKHYLSEEVGINRFPSKIICRLYGSVSKTRPYILDGSLTLATVHKDDAPFHLLTRYLRESVLSVHLFKLPCQNGSHALFNSETNISYNKISFQASKFLIEHNTSMQ